MKLILITALALALLPDPAHAAAHLLKAYQPGFTPTRRSATCEVFHDRIVITRILNGRVYSRRSLRYRWPQRTPQMLSEARLGRHLGNCNVTDVPTTTWSIVGAGSPYLLREDCDPGQGIRNFSQSTPQLTGLLDSLCGSLQ